MISTEQLKEFAKKYKINEAIVAREFVQVTFLKELYEQRLSKDVFFKGGTAIRLIYGGKRFSEDLDFTVNTNEEVFIEKLNDLFRQLSNKYLFKFKEKDTLAGRTFLLTAEVPNLKAPSYVKLDFSMRENVLNPVQALLKTEYPIIIQSFINCLGKDEIFAEKIRAVIKREKQRDLYDLWVLYELGTVPNLDLISRKMAFYGEKFDKDALLSGLQKFDKKKFILDLKPFVSINERGKLGDLFDYINKYLVESLQQL